MKKIKTSYRHVLAHVLTPLQTAEPLCPSGCLGQNGAQLCGPSEETGPHWPSPDRREPHPRSCLLSLSASFSAEREDERST